MPRLIANLPGQLQMATVADGVENVEHVTKALVAGCDEVPGFYFSKPLPADQVDKLLARNRPSPIVTDIETPGKPNGLDLARGEAPLARSVVTMSRRTLPRPTRWQTATLLQALLQAVQPVIAARRACMTSRLRLGADIAERLQG